MTTKQTDRRKDNSITFYEGKKYTVSCEHMVLHVDAAPRTPRVQNCCTTQIYAGFLNQ